MQHTAQQLWPVGHRHLPATAQAVCADRAGGVPPLVSGLLQLPSAMSSTNRSAVGRLAKSSPPKTKILLPIFVACAGGVKARCAALLTVLWTAKSDTPPAAGSLRCQAVRARQGD